MVNAVKGIAEKSSNMDSEFRSKAEEKAYLSKIIKEWNASRLDMFALTDPNEVNKQLTRIKSSHWLNLPSSFVYCSVTR